MNDEARKRVERIDAIRRFHRTTHPGPCDTCFLLAIIDRERVATSEDVERVADAVYYVDCGIPDPGPWVSHHTLTRAQQKEVAIAALRAMNFEVKE